jgi:hypothetical protein
MMRVAMIAAAWLVAGCASQPSQPVTAEKATVAQAPPIPPFDSNARPHLEKETFALELGTATSASTAQPSLISITIEGRGGYHVNLEYPVRIELGASEGAALSRTVLTAVDARELSEARARFETHARWSSTGRHWLATRVQFAVCTQDTCVPRQESLAVFVDVQ